ncbi:hypothetical protein MMB232_01951 [Brevundimonas subvibrioides]|uniref:cupin domain-containing protein n=1 Tax=Brevundimonas subvibrioides TaxID=74313 RepID=UPI0032D592DD
MSSASLMYASSDPRAGLSTAKVGGSAPADRGFGASSYALYGELVPPIDDESGRTWLTRGQNFVIAYTEAKPGARFERRDQVDEYVALIEGAATVRAGAETVQVNGGHIVMIPPGNSHLELPDGGTLVRLFTTRSLDLAALAANAHVYAEPAPFIPPLEPWPDPAGGFRIRAYDLNVPPQEGRFGRIWRCTTFMVNVFEPAGPRDVTKLSPHHHDDFEQGSLALGGSFIHHLRWPWTENSLDWRDDEHMLCPAPSVAIIPPRSIHTSASVAAEDNRLVDIFSPPRADFSAMAGWVLNADDYPMPG